MDEKVARAFRDIYLGKRTGVLMCESADVKRAVLFRSGFAVGARSNRTEDRLGEVLIRHGRITKRHFEDASHFIKSGWKLGEILAQLGVIRKEEIEHYIRIQLLEIACGALVNPPQKMIFSEFSSVDTVVKDPLSVANILMEGARKTPAIEPFKRALLADERRLGFSSDPVLRFQDVSLSPEEAYVLSRIDGEQPTRGIFALSPLSEEQTARTLLGLIQAGIIVSEGERRSEPEPAVEETEESQRSQSTSEEAARLAVDQAFEEFRVKDNWQVLGVERAASEEEVRHAFQEKARFYHPDRYRHIADPDTQEKISYIFHRIAEAHETLSIQAKAESYQKLADKEPQYEKKQKAWGAPSKQSAKEKVKQLARTRDPAEARGLFARAKRAYELEDYWNAIQLCQQAIDIVGDQSEYYHLLGLALAKNPKWRQDAEKNLKIAINLDPWKSAYLGSLGRLYQEAGLKVRAKRVFEQAIAVDPTFKVPNL